MNVKHTTKKALLVLGMHRSGTSATARVLNLLGAHLGSDMVEPGADNPDGFWEHAEAVRINDELLHALGRTWYDMREMQPGWQDTEAAQVALGRIDELVARDFLPHDLIAIKDPRICLTAPLWIKSLQRHGYRAECLFVVRDPREVVDSLHVRNNWKRAPLFLMWVQYLMEAEAATRHQRRTLISYDELLADWQAAMKRVAGEFALDWPVSPAKAVAQVGEFLKPANRHHVAQASGESADDMPELASKLYLECLAICRGEKSWGAFPRLEKTYRSVASLYAEHVDELLNLRWQAEARAITAEAKSGRQQFAVDIGRLSDEIGQSMATGHDLLMHKMETMVTAMAGKTDQLAGQFQTLQHELYEKSRKDEEREVASEARLQSLDNRIHELAKQTVATELQSATTLAAMSVRVEHQDAALIEVKDATRRLGTQVEAISADFVAQFQGLAGSLDQSIGQLQAQAQSQDATLRERLEQSDATVQELTQALDRSMGQLHAQLQSQYATLSKRLDGTDANVQELALDIQQAVNQLQGRFDAIGDDFLTHSRNADGFVSMALQRIDSIEAGQSAYLELVNSANARVVEQFNQRVEAMGAELGSRVDHLQSALARREARVQAIGDELATSAARLHDIETSTSWRVTAPLRWIRKALMLRTWKVALGRTAKAIYDHLPLSAKRRIYLKGVIFRALSPMLRNTQSYRAWQAFEAHRGSGPLHAAASNSRKTSSAWAGAVSVEAEPAASVTVTDVAGQQNVSGQVLAELQAAAGSVANEHVALDDKPADTSRIDVRAIAFYLPQFHPIPENDAWWGRGFTEWTNVSKAMPQFVGHYQPRLPGELGFYDLRLVDVMRRQVELAKHYGLQGFCFHYYWFGGRRLLEKPLEQFLANTDIDFPFCICWANENWSRRWDGMDQDILVGQSHSPEDDIAFITALEPLLRDPRYIRVDGKPLIVLYRPAILPDAKATQRRWREHCRKVGIGEIMLAMVQFDVEDPRTFEFDVAIEFPPHKLARGLEPINSQMQIVNPEYSGYVIDYGSVIERARSHRAAGFNMIRGVFPSWDNEARKPGRGYTFANATPGRYREWLDLAIDYAREHPVSGERLVFINAWNEWAEGAYLEPDRRYGYAYLQQTRDALLARPGAHLVRGRQVAIVSHDAHPHGAQYLALNLARELKNGLGMQVHVLLMSGGPLASGFAETADVHDLSEMSADDLVTLLGRLRKGGVELVIANTAVSGRLTRMIAAAGLRVVTLVHELPKLIREYGLEQAVQDLVTHSDRVVLPSEAVSVGMKQFADEKLLASKAVLRPQGLFTRSKYRGAANLTEARANLRAKLKLPADARVVLAVGYADRRKGVDLLLSAAAICCKSDPLLHFVWVGHTDATLDRENASAITKGMLQSRFHFVGMDFETDDYYAGADLYALTSREDPFPSVVLESLSVGTPVVAFAGTGGGADLVMRGGGTVVPAFDIVQYAEAVTNLLADDAERDRLGAQGIEIVDAEFSFRTYVMDLLQLGGLQVPRVSVVVPNFNYARYLHDRLASITAQTVPIYEIIFLDDQSDDHSIETIQELRHSLNPEPRIVINHSNSGSVFLQWHRGVQLARGDYVWIAEADDLAKPDFLERVLEGIHAEPEAVLGYCQSEAIDEHGALLMQDYLSYTDDLSKDRWLQSYLADGADEVEAALAIKNTIPNVSAVLFRRKPLLDVLDAQLDEIVRYRVAGDWIVYLKLLRNGKIFYSAHVCNRHRRHQRSVTLETHADMHYREVVELQKLASATFSLSERSLKSALDYRIRVSEHLGIGNIAEHGSGQC